MTFRDRRLPARKRRSGSGPLGALPELSPATRRALAGCGLLAAGNALATVAMAWSLATTLAHIVAGHPGLSALPVLGISVLARAVLAWATTTVAARAAATAKAELRAKLLDAALSHGPEWIDARGPAELATTATRGLDALDGYFTQFLPALVTAVTVPPVVGATILLADWRSAVLVAVTVPLLPLFAVLIGRFTADRVAHAAEASGKLAGHLLELLRALPVLTAFGRAAAQAESVRAVSERHRKATTSTLRIAFSSALALDVLATLSVALVAVDIGLRLVSGGLGLATGLLVLILVPECYLPVRAVGSAFHASQDGLDAVNRVTEVVGAEGSAVPAHPVGAGSRQGVGDHTVRPDPPRRQLVVSQLRVARRDGFAPDGASFAVTPGEITRLDSPSGAGKSSTLAAVLRFTDYQGSISVDGHELSTIERKAWLEQVAWVPQNPRFLTDTVFSELRSACPDATGTDLTEITESVAAGHLLDRRIAELSTGERQRVALARALLRLRHGAWLLLLDEPTAHVDPATAAILGTAITTAADSGAAVLLATHRDLAAGARPVGEPTPVPAPTLETPTPQRVSLRGLFDWRAAAGALLGAAALGSAVALTATAAWLIARAAQHPAIFTLSVAVVAVRTFGLAKGVLRYAERLVSHDAAFRRSGTLRVALWRAMVRLGPARGAAGRRTDGLRRLVDDTDAVRDLMPRVLLPPLSALLVGALAVTGLTWILPGAGLVLLIALLIAGLAGPVLALLAERNATSTQAAGRRAVSGRVLDLLDRAAELVAFGADQHRRQELAEADAGLSALAHRAARAAGLARALSVGALGLAALANAWLAAVSTGLNPVLAPLLALVPLALAETVDGLAPALAQLDPLRAAYARVTTLLNEPAPKTEVAYGDLELTGVSATWPGAGHPALHDVTLHIPPGTQVAVVGPSGAGKSTLVALLLGFLPAEGHAVIPQKVAWCPQEPQLAATTVRENLKLGRATATDAELRAALRTAGLDTWTDRLDVLLGPGGAGASGGEAARLSLARALLRAPEAGLILLDEPTAHLDVPTAERVLANLDTALAGATVLHVTHRPAEAARADLVVEVRDGRVRVSKPTTSATGGRA